MLAEILFAAVAQPDTQDLGDAIFLDFAQPFVKCEGAGALEPAGPVAVGIPVGAREADAARGLLHEFLAAQFVVGLSFGRHPWKKLPIHVAREPEVSLAGISEPKETCTG